MHEMNPEIKTLSRRTIARDLNKVVKVEVLPSLKRDMVPLPENSVHLILDIWSSRSREGIIGIKAQFLSGSKIVL